MTCRICGESAPVCKTIKENDHVVRYRRCNKCEHEFRTLEMDEDMWGKLAAMKQIDDVAETIAKAISDHATISSSGSIKKMAKFIAHRLFARVSHEM